MSTLPHLLDLLFEQFKGQTAATAAEPAEEPAEEHHGKGHGKGHSSKGKPGPKPAAKVAPKAAPKSPTAEEFRDFARAFCMRQYGASVSLGYGHGGTVVRLVDGTLAQLFPLPGEAAPPPVAAVAITQPLGTQPLPPSGSVDIFATPESFRPTTGFR